MWEALPLKYPVPTRSFIATLNGRSTSIPFILLYTCNVQSCLSEQSSRTSVIVEEVATVQERGKRAGIPADVLLSPYFSEHLKLSLLCEKNPSPAKVAVLRNLSHGALHGVLTVCLLRFSPCHFGPPASPAVPQHYS